MGPVQASRPDWWQRPRIKWMRALLALLIFSGTFGVVAGSYIGLLRLASCRDELASNGLVVRICGPFGTSDIVVIGLALGLAAICIWPELSEVGIPGLFTLKKQIAANARKTDEVAADVRGLTAAQAIPEVGDAISASRVALGQAQGVIIQPSHEPRVLSTSRESNEAELLAQIGRVDTFLAILDSRTPVVRMQEEARKGTVKGEDLIAQLQALVRWQAAFEAPLRTFASVRNLALHFPERLSDDQVLSTVEVGRSLLRGLSTYLDDASKKGVDVTNRTRVVSVNSILADGSRIAPSGVLRLTEDQPSVGVRGPRGWGLSGEAEILGVLPDEPELSMTLGDGRTLSGQAILTNQRMSSDSGGVRSTFEYLGNGPLAGATDTDFA